jgi:hypothetical protein
MTMQENVPAGTRMDGPGGPTERHVARRRVSTETKASFKTTELLAYLGAVIGVIVMSYLVKTTSTHSDYFRADKAMFYIVILTVGYMVSRGIAKAGSRDFYDDRD